LIDTNRCSHYRQSASPASHQRPDGRAKQFVSWLFDEKVQEHFLDELTPFCG
jgi:hypothetical protein